MERAISQIHLHHNRKLTFNQVQASDRRHTAHLRSRWRAPKPSCSQWGALPHRTCRVCKDSVTSVIMDVKDRRKILSLCHLMRNMCKRQQGDTTPMTRADRQDSVRVQSTCAQRTLSRKWKNKPQNGRNFANFISDKGLVSRIHRELL